MEQTFGAIFLGMDWGAEYENPATPANAAIGRITRQDALELTLKETRAALPAASAPGGTVDILALSDIVLAKVCSHYFDIPDGVHVKAGGFGVSNLMSPGVCPTDYTPPSAYIFYPDPDVLLTFIGQRTGTNSKGVGRQICRRKTRGRPDPVRATRPRAVRANPRPKGQRPVGAHHRRRDDRRAADDQRQSDGCRQIVGSDRQP